MGTKATLLLLLAVLCYGLASTAAHHHHHGEEEEGGGGGDWRGAGEEMEDRHHRGEKAFLLRDWKRVVHTDAGEMRVLRSFRSQRSAERSTRIGFINMEPSTLFIPQYTDSGLVLFVRKGEARLGTIYRNEPVERSLRKGDMYRIPAGSAFYLVNTGESRKLRVICSIEIDTSEEDLPTRNFQSFFLGGGPNPASILTGFDPETLATAFNVSSGEVQEILSREIEGPIVHMSDSRRPSAWSKFMELDEQDRLRHLRKAVREYGDEDEDEDEDEQIEWSWRKLLESVLGRRRRPESRDEWGHRHAPDSCNLYDRSPDFRNDYGWSVALDEYDYKPLRHSGIGIYLVNLSPGSMMAPHVNPTATEYGIVLSGSGTIQIGYPNGSSAMNARVREGDVFWIPRYFPFCQISSNSGSLEFFGFTTSARRNRPQFLAGRNSVLRAMGGPELARSFGVSDKRLAELLRAQRESVILPSPEAAAAGGPDQGFDGGDLVADF
ncbi:hypothetical protein ACJRO7_011830 [Eucalyptus globulus]|uniref:Cupin type-1 domain-containing protein n=1 Tax=Eucalyptus globulus TaxID=34317 RepID=A0ABD3LGI7_EUCGL